MIAFTDVLDLSGTSDSLKAKIRALKAQEEAREAEENRKEKQRVEMRRQDVSREGISKEIRHEVKKAESRIIMVR